MPSTRRARAVDDTYVGIGANLGDARDTVRSAITELGRLPLTRLLASSSCYRSAPLDARGGDFVNAVVRLSTRLDAHRLLAELQRIERRYGRERPYPNAPRTLDLDLLLMGDLAIESPGLTLPHPRMHLRAFVLVPLAEINPTLRLPGRPALAELIAQVADQRVERLAT